MMKKSLIALGFAFTLAACGPSQQPPADQAAQQPAAAAPAPAPAAAPAPAPAAPSAADAEVAKMKAEERKLHREEAEMKQQSQAAQAQAAAAPPPCTDCGVIASITPVKQEGQMGVVGGLAGAAGGGLLGNQFGKGKGKTAMTVAGVLGGALAGAEAQKALTSSTAYQVAVNMETGGQRTVTLKSAEGLAVGTRVHVDGSNLLPY